MAVKLRPHTGDVVGLVGETDEGLIRGRALVMGQTDSEDWYVGELEDGSRVEFRIDQVETLEPANYGMSGIMDWFGPKKKEAPPESRAMIPVSDPGSVIYVGPTGVARYEGPGEQRPGFLRRAGQKIKEALTPQEGAPSMFDFFKNPSAMVPGEIKDPLPYVPTEKTLEPFKKRVSSLVPSEAPKSIRDLREKIFSFFKHVKPSPVEEPAEMVQAKEEYAPAAHEEPAEESRPLPEIVPFRDDEVVSVEQFLDSHTYGEVVRAGEGFIFKPRILELPPRTTALPSVQDVARALATQMDRDMWEELIDERKKYYNDGALAVALMVLELGTSNGEPSLEAAIPIFLQVPEAYLGEEEGELLNSELEMMARDIIARAYEMIAPPELPGDFVVDVRNDWPETLAVYYIEKFRELSDEEEHDFEKEGGHLYESGMIPWYERGSIGVFPAGDEPEVEPAEEPGYDEAQGELFPEEEPAMEEEAPPVQEPKPKAKKKKKKSGKAKGKR